MESPETTRPGEGPLPSDRPGLARNPWGWIGLAALFVLLIVGALTRSFGQGGQSDPALKTAERLIESAVSLAASGGVLARDEKTNLAKARETITGRSPEAAFLRIVVDRELGRSPAPEDVRAARAVPRELAGAAALAIEEKPARVEPATGTDERFSARLARAQARERAGTPRKEARAGLVRPDYVLRLGLFGLGVFGAAALGISLWLWYLLARANGNYRPQGLPSLPMTPAEADRFALRALVMLGAFLVGSTLVGLLRLPTTAALLGQAVLLGALALYSLRLPPDARVPHLSARGLGIERERLGERIAWGVAGALANVPILLVVLVLSNLLLKHVPPPTHPSTEALTGNPSLVTILLTFFLATICAPIWEEIFFRGLVFQGLVGARMAAVPAALLSSLLFAAIHPQGIALWPALAGVALMGCALLGQTRSIVSSIAMHATHNALTVAAALVAGPVMGTVSVPGWAAW